MTNYPDVDIDDVDNPELLDADVALMRPGADSLPASVVGAVAGLATFQVYENARQDWRWTLKSADGRAVATSFEGYASRQKALEVIEMVKRALRGSQVIG